MLEIVLKIDGENKTFRQGFISVRMLKDTLEATTVVNKNTLYGEDVDELAHYLVRLYGKQFTYDELIDGFVGKDFVNKVVEDIGIALDKVSKKTEDIAKN